jgi:hypothetical protein
MRDTGHVNEQGPLPLQRAGISHAEVESQLQKISHSKALEGKWAQKRLLEYLVRESLGGNLQRLRVAAICKTVFRRYSPGDSRARKEAGYLRDSLDDYYASPEADPAEIRLSIPEGGYVVYALVPPAAVIRSRDREIDRPGRAFISEPANGSEVYSRVTFRGRIEGIDLDLRLWLVLATPAGVLYPQCRVKRNNQPDWQEEAGVGRPMWGTSENVEYAMHLVTADVDGDFAFHEFLKSGRDGFGHLMPSDCRLMDSKRYVRRDIRTKE